MTKPILRASDLTKVFDDIGGAVGKTPLVRLNRTARSVNPAMYAKLEFFNPGGSVKDRIAPTMIDVFESNDQLEAGGTVVEATSGNTGVGLAITCALRGYKAIFVMPDKMSQEKIQLLRAFGARVVITPTAVPPEDPRSYYSVAQRIVDETPNAVLANQYHNPANPESHFHTTAPEIWEQTEGKVTDIVVGMGTGGTITGIARYLRENKHPVRVVGVDPIGSLLYEAWKQGGYSDDLEATTYKVEGIGEDFIPSTLDLGLVDEVVQVTDEESFLWTRRLVREEGIFCGGSSGAAMAGALKIATDLPEDRLIVVLFPDSGSRYLSKVFDDDWMLEHGFMQFDLRKASASTVAQSRGLPSLVTAHQDDRLLDVVARMRESAISQLPVVDEQGRLLGLVSEVSLLNFMLTAEETDIQSETIEDKIDQNVLASPESETLDQILPELMDKKVVVLIDDNRIPTGILTVIDALEFLARS
jgi:cystathionine beta-synthase